MCFTNNLKTSDNRYIRYRIRFTSVTQTYDWCHLLWKMICKLNLIQIYRSCRFGNSRRRCCTTAPLVAIFNLFWTTSARSDSFSGCNTFGRSCFFLYHADGSARFTFVAALDNTLEVLYDSFKTFHNASFDCGALAFFADCNLVSLSISFLFQLSWVRVKSTAFL